MKYEELIERIHHTNQCWHLATLFNQNRTLSDYFLKRKNHLQVELLTRFASLVRLEEDLQQEENEKLFSIRLLRGVSGYQDACHIPERILIAYHIQPARNFEGL